MALRKTVAPVRRTQRDRRESTIAKLLDATIESILEVGYARTSVKEICARAGVSHGGLFRHFESLVELYGAVSEEVGRRQIASIEAGFAHAAASDEPLVTALHSMREASRAPINAVFYELIVAARTDEALRRALRSFGESYSTAVWNAVARMPGAERFPPERLAVIASSAMHLFDGEAMTRSVLELPGLEERRMVLLERLVESIAEEGGASPKRSKGRSAKRA